MRLVGIVVVATLSAALIAQGAYIVHTNRKVATLSERLEALAAEQESGGGARATAAWPSGGSQRAGDGDGEPGERRRLPPPKLIVPPPSADNQAAPPRLHNSGEGAALPPALDNPEAREQLRNFVLSTLDQQRQEQRDRMDQRRDEMMKERRDRQAKELGLSASETQKFNEIFTNAQNARQDLRSKIEGGQLQGEAVRQEMSALREKTQQQIQSLLGPDRAKKLEEMQRRDGNGWRGGGGPGGGGPGGGGPGGGGPGGGGFFRRGPGAEGAPPPPPAP
jgi:hypothetical protein